MMISTQICPCRVLANPTTPAEFISYGQCCQPLHQSARATDSAERLMRSRYSAFVLVLLDYIVATTLPAQRKLLDKSAIEAWAKDTDWAGLEIVKHTPKIGKHHAQVEFNAYFNSLEGLQAHHELSSFVKARDMTESKSEQTNWYFLDPTVAMTVTQKQPCICGSGEKFKRCCGRFI